jgi:hypothetical protein
LVFKTKTQTLVLKNAACMLEYYDRRTVETATTQSGLRVSE